MKINDIDDQNVPLPQYLYRGIKLTDPTKWTELESTKALTVPYEPLIDQYGRKVVKDGNEYGVYMSDNLTMIENVYGNLHNDGLPIRSDITLGIERRYIQIPAVGVIYQISTDGLNVRQPFIADHLKGHYNNGFAGHEWIADQIPAQNYTIIRVRIGQDLLHDQEDLDLTKPISIKEQLKNKMDLRRYRLEVFANLIQQFSSSQRRSFDSITLDLFKEIFGEHGIKYTLSKNIDTTQPDGMIRYLLQKEYMANERAMDLNTLEYIYSLKGRFETNEALLNELKERLTTFERKKAELLKQTKKENAKQTYIDSKRTLYTTLITNLETRRKEDQHRGPVINPEPNHSLTVSLDNQPGRKRR